METASADSMPEGVERQGIGTPATRAATIEKLVQKGFLERKGTKKTKVLLPTDKGKALITVIPEEIQSPEMTADWETKLLRIERSEMEPSEFMTEINTMITELVKNTEMKKGVNAPKVSYRDGHYYVFDGQHTIAARKLLNNNCDLNIVCKVYSGLTEQQEALLFAQQTGVSAPLTAGAKMRAKIRGGDPEAIAFLNATNRAGFGLSFAQSHAKWKIACIATAFAEYRKHGERIYTDALRVLAEAWEGDIDSLRAEVLQGVTQFVALYDHEYDPIRLIRQLQRTSPVAIYRSGQAMTGPNYQKYMLQILKTYNGSSRTKSLPIKQ